MAGTTFSIYPAIGVARLGDAPTEFYIGPEAYRGLPTLLNGAHFKSKDFRDAKGHLRRQAARFRIYRENGSNSEEVTLDTADVKEIRWRVHLANKKAAWYQFVTSSGAHGYPPDHALRNAEKKTTKDRLRLIIDAGPRAISGRNAGAAGKRVEFSRSTIPPGYKGGSFPPRSLKPFAIDTLGGLQTDAHGRLLVLGGHGCSGSTNANPPSLDYANNDDWWDDTSDGPVQATVTLKSGESFEAAPAWVIVAPPKYAPQLANLVTLYDTIFDSVVRLQGGRPEIFQNGFWNSGPDGYRPSFASDVRPIFERAAGYRWVAAIPTKPHTFDFARLGNADQALNEFRKYYLDALRPPLNENVLVNGSSGTTMMPYLAGDDCLSPADQSTSKYLRLTDTQYFFLQQWADGHFDQAARSEPHPGHRLTRAVLENCVGGAFSPGIEVTWISRDPAIYESPFRIRVRRAIPDPLSLGFDPEAGMEPGDVSRYMALPWQADFNECSSQPIDGRILWWWPVQRPEFVYLKARIKTQRQVAWVGADYDQNADDYIGFAEDIEMVSKWSQLGFIHNVGSDEHERFVEVERTLKRGATAPSKKK
jgi:hypothetical protein